jgi:hypothetical protein
MALSIRNSLGDSLNKVGVTILASYGVGKPLTH